MHKLVYEAMMWMVEKIFFEWLEIQYNAFFLEVAAGMETFVFWLFQGRFKFLQRNHWVTICYRPTNIFTLQTFYQLLRTNSGPLLAYWFHYIELVEILLDLIRSHKQGGCNLCVCVYIYIYRYCVVSKNWCFSLDKINYARYLSFHYIYKLLTYVILDDDKQYCQHFLIFLLHGSKNMSRV